MEQEPVSHLRGKYAIQQRSVRFLLSIIDRVLGFVIRRRRRDIVSPKRILLFLSGHFGDAVLVTALFAPLKAMRQEIQIGIVTGSWNYEVLKDHPDIYRLHVYDQWRCCRKKIRCTQKLWRHISSGIGALRSIRKELYDVAVVLSPFYANGVLFMSLSGIRQRIGFDCGGYGPLLTHPVKGPKTIDHITSYHLQLLGQIRGFNSPTSPLRPDLKLIGIGDSPVSRKDYLVINIGAGAECRKWPVSKWHMLVEHLVNQGHYVVLTGLGPIEVAQAKEIADGIKAGVLNLCDQLSWDEFVSVIQGASLLIANDSAAGHLGSCFSIPSVILFSGVRSPIISFKPLNDWMIPLMEPVVCNPCFTVERGCRTMECIRTIQVSSVCQAIDYLTASRATLVPSGAGGQ